MGGGVDLHHRPVKRGRIVGQPQALARACQCGNLVRVKPEHRNPMGQRRPGQIG